jgi:glycosyltransferase involved in cell wall biosynthesis
MRYEPGLVSVITPCYNAARFVAETIASVAAQTYAPLEHIIVDDGSTDESWAVIESFGSRVNAVRLEHNRGGSHARNRGAECARGEFLMFLDSDDLIAPDTLGALVQAVRARPAAIGVCSWRRLLLVRGKWVEAPPEASLPLLDDPLRGWLQNCWVPPCAVLWRRDAYERAGEWDERITLNDDGDLMMRAFVRGCSLVSAVEGRAFYRHHGETRLSLSNDVFSEPRLRSLCLVLENLISELRRAERLPAYRASLGEAYYNLASLSFQLKSIHIGRECVARAVELVGRRATGRIWPGQLLTLLLGVESKERVVEALASVGIMTPTRRKTRAIHRLYARRAG